MAIEGLSCKDVEVTDYQNDPLSVRRADIDVFTGITFTVGAGTGASSFSWSWAQNPGDFAEIISGGDTHTATVNFTKSLPAVGTYILQVEMGGLACGTAGRRLTIDIRDRSCNCTSQLVEVTSPITGRIWMDRDLGAKSRINGTSPGTDYGCLFQYGRANDGHADVVWTTRRGTYKNGTSTVQSSDGISRTNKHNNTHSNWTSLDISDTRALWDGVDAINNPCPSGFRIPRATEFTAEFQGAIDQGKTWAMEGTSSSDWFTSVRYGFQSSLTTGIQTTSLSIYAYWAVNTTGGAVFLHQKTTADWNSLYNHTGFDSPEYNYLDHSITVRCIKD